MWKQRLRTIDSNVEAIQLPNGNGRLDQDEEWCLVTVDGRPQRIRFHDYASIYEIPGLYERLFYEELECCSPFRVTRLLAEILKERGQDTRSLRVLDLGAGNGMVGDELRRLGAEAVVGVDIIPEARQAAQRDRRGLYRDYVVADMTDLASEEQERLAAQRCNCLTTVATLGFGDIPPAAFSKAISLISTPGWLAFNIKEDFLHETDDTGFGRLVRRLMEEEVIRLEAYRRYRHRLNVSGDPLYYVAIVATKQKAAPAELTSS